MRPPGVEGCSVGADGADGAERRVSSGTSSMAKLSMDVAGSNGARCVSGAGGGFRGGEVRKARVLWMRRDLIMLARMGHSGLRRRSRASAGDSSRGDGVRTEGRTSWCPWWPYLASHPRTLHTDQNTIPQRTQSHAPSLHLYCASSSGSVTSSCRVSSRSRSETVVWVSGTSVAERESTSMMVCAEWTGMRLCRDTRSLGDPRLVSSRLLPRDD